MDLRSSFVISGKLADKLTGNAVPEVRAVQGATGIGSDGINKLAVDPNSKWLSVPFGNITFAAEGQENSSRYFSRVLHYPGGAASGVTIGRGYDLGNRSKLEISRDLVASGVDTTIAARIAQGAGLKGSAAASFVREYRNQIPPICQQAQYRLFTDVVAPSYVKDIVRIFNKPDVVAKYGNAHWDALPQEMQELVFDLRYRGDYTPETRKLLQSALVSADRDSFFSVIRDEGYWLQRGVPASRVAARIAATYAH